MQSVTSFGDKDLVLVINNRLYVGVFPNSIGYSLVLFHGLELSLVPILNHNLFLPANHDLVCQIRVLLSDLDLLI